MAKESGLGANLYLDGWDLSGDTSSVSTISKSLEPLNLTGIDKSATERLPGALKGQMSWTTFFNPTNAHLALANNSATDRIGSYFHRATLGTPVASMVAKQTTIKHKRDSDGGFTADVDLLANAWWLDWGLALTPGVRTHTTATSDTGVDFGASYAFGLQAYLHVFAFTGTSVTVTLQESSDNGVGDAWAAVTGGAFTAVTAAHSKQRIATARDQTVERYLRVVTTGTFTNATFAVSVTVNQSDLTI